MCTLSTGAPAFWRFMPVHRCESVNLNIPNADIFMPCTSIVFLKGTTRLLPVLVAILVKCRLFSVISWTLKVKLNIPAICILHTIFGWRSDPVVLPLWLDNAGEEGALDIQKMTGLNPGGGTNSQAIAAGERAASNRLWFYLIILWHSFSAWLLIMPPSGLELGIWGWIYL